MTALLTFLVGFAAADAEKLFGNGGFGGNSGFGGGAGGGGGNGFSFGGGSQPSQGGGFGGSSLGESSEPSTSTDSSSAGGNDILALEKQEELKAEGVEQEAQQNILGVERKEREVRAQQIAEEQREIEEEHNHAVQQHKGSNNMRGQQE